MARKLFQLVGEVTISGVAGLNKKLNEVDKKANKVSRQFKMLGKRIGAVGSTFTKTLTAPLAAVGASFVLAAEKVGQYADSILDLKAITGLSTDSLQEFENVAREAGVDFQGLTKTISMFSSKLPTIARGTGPAYDAIQRLGVSLKDSSGNIRDMNDLFPEMVNRLQAIENVTERNSVAQQIFGTRLTALGPVLGMTAEEMQKAREEAHELGLVMTGDALDAANEYRKESEKLRAEFTAFWRNLAIKVIPILKDDLIPFLRNTMQPLIVSVADKIAGLTKKFSGMSETAKVNTVKFVALAAAIGPILLIVSQLIPLVTTLTTVIGYLNVAFLANPFVLAAAAIVGIAVAIDQTGKAWKKWSDDLGENIAQKQTNALKGDLERIIPMYGELIAMSSRGILNQEDADQFERLSVEVEALETNIADLGTALEGGLVNRMNQAENQLTDMDEELGKVAESTGEVTAEVDKNTKGVDKNAAALAKQAKAEKDVTEAQKAYKQAQEQEEYNKMLDESIEEAKQKQQDYYDSIVQMALVSEASQLDLLELEFDAKMEAAEKELAGHVDLEKAKTLISEEYARKRAGIEQTSQQQVHATQQAGLEFEQMLQDDRVRMSIGAIMQIGEIASQFNQNKMMELDKVYKKDKQAIEQSTMNEEEKAAAIKKLDEDLDKEKLKLQKKQAKREKRLAIFAAIINTAQAISKALTLAFPLNIIMAALTGVLGAVQIGAIAAQPLPFAKGGLVKGSRGGVVGEIGESTQDELILPMKTGVVALADALVGKLSEMTSPRMPQMAMATGGGGRTVYENHYHIGTFIGDDEGLKELDRRLLPFRISEDQRKGNI